MLVSLEWLNEYVNISDLTPEQIAHELTMSGLEVEEIEKKGADFSNIVVAEIKEVRPHPNADKLQLADIFNGKENKTVVCGAKNIEKGQLVPYASVGSEVKDRHTGEKFSLKPIKIRGVDSEGMLCSAEELGLDPADYLEGILILNGFKKDITPGQDVKEVLGIQEDVILHVAPTANRGDEMSLIGIAREVSAIFNKKIKYPEISSIESPVKTDFQVEIIDEDTCKYYSAGIVKNIKIKHSPDWMIRRLKASGIRSINNIVDITNYVMLEYGQPLHAFDMAKLDGNYLCVRRAKEGEKMVTLDEIERSLNHDSIIIGDKNKAVGLAGLMGGYNSEVDDSTKDIVLESAYFTPVTNRRSSRSVGLRTEACARFERGVDIASVKPALIRAMELIKEHADAETISIVEDGDNTLPDIEITLRFSQIKRVMGIEIPNFRCIEILEHLGFELLGRNDFSAKCLVPGYRRNDITREIDIIEEIGRIHGYDKIEPTLPRKTISAELSKETQIICKINQILLSNGLNEVVTSSLVGLPLLKWIGIDYNDAQAVKVQNPQSDDYTMLRQNLIPSIVQVVKHNFDQGQKNIWIYEIGKTFFFKGAPNYQNTGVEENRVLAGALSGNINSGSWHQIEQTDFYTMKGIVEALLKELNLEGRTEYKPLSAVSYLHPGRAAEIRLAGKNPIQIGILGELHPDLNERCKLAQPVYIFELDLDKILENLSYSAPRYKELPLYPSVLRDIAFIISKDHSYQEISRIIKKSSSLLVRKIEIFDVYEGKNIADNARSLAFRLTLLDTEATLTDERVDSEMKNIREGLKKVYPEISFRE